MDPHDTLFAPRTSSHIPSLSLFAPLLSLLSREPLSTTQEKGCVFFFFCRLSGKEHLTLKGKRHTCCLSPHKCLSQYLSITDKSPRCLASYAEVTVQKWLMWEKELQDQLQITITLKKKQFKVSPVAANFIDFMCRRWEEGQVFSTQ